MTIRLYNTATRKLEEFTPPTPHTVTLYNCGPTVYNYPHIGNLRAYVFADVLRRTFEAEGYAVQQVINITDVGHLVSDADEGEDKMEVGAKREGKSVEEIIALYSNAFYADLVALNVKAAVDRGKEECFPRATHHIAEQKELVEALAKKGYTYSTSDGIYFDTSKFPKYADFARLDIKGMEAGARVDMGKKKHPTDFALWKFSPQDGQKREQEWDSPLGIARKGFPGWHVECSAMSRKYLGQPFDIHTGGIDHIPVHHTNEIAQSEAAYDTPLARYWMHCAFMTVDGQKMSKSLGNTYRLSDLAARGISPMAFRYWLLTASYRTTVNFTWEALEGAQKAYEKLRRDLYEIKDNDIAPEVDWMAYVNEDFNTAKLLALIQEETKAKYLLAKEADNILGLDLLGYVPFEIVITSELQSLLDARKKARNEKNWAESDRLRDEIKKLGYIVKDTPEGQRLEKR